jgi:hypothetical protein
MDFKWLDLSIFDLNLKGVDELNTPTKNTSDHKKDSWS